MILILSALLFSLSSNLDNLVIGIAYGVKNIKIGTFANLLIAIVTSIGTFLSMSIGKYISKLLPHYVANSLGAIIIIILGIYFIIQSIIKLMNNTKQKELSLKDITDMLEYAETSDLDKSGDINIKEASFVALGLTFNNLGTGIAASITGVNITFTVAFTFIFSIITIIIGEVFGTHVLGKVLGKYAPLISGILLIILGIVEFIN
ncbi:MULTISPECIES: sporulation membrane protein YtaF [Clostridium]|uniref:sporulation membrane protein YtaF n=1 Tax=Clostridium TaxID=1485 RepID=UPI00069EE263|nr:MULTISPECIES: sporulation membrane protein YtaF [Clostridium]KOF55628.1 sporulation protein [Clostridium sp. DMHC 10]MCD2347673.1 sporulation membrane protein YtaF [Clostridium guangxiense]